MINRDDFAGTALRRALKIEQAMKLAIKRAAEICTNADPDQWDALGEAEIIVIEPDVRDAFAKQIRESIRGIREIRDGLLNRRPKDEEPD